MESVFRNDVYKVESQLNTSLEPQNNLIEDGYQSADFKLDGSALNSGGFEGAPGSNLDLKQNEDSIKSRSNFGKPSSLSPDIMIYDLEGVERNSGQHDSSLGLVSTVTVLVDSFLNLDNEHRVLFIRFFVTKMTVQDFDVLQEVIELRNTVKSEIIPPVQDDVKSQSAQNDKKTPLDKTEISHSSPKDKPNANWPENHPKRFCNVSFEEGDFDINFDEENDGLNVLTALKKIKVECDNEKKDKPYECEVCAKAFYQKNNLIIHKRKHTGETPYDCKECGKKFGDSRLLARHMRKHSGDKLYHCDQCSKTFLQLDHLTRHKRVHTGEKPFDCPQCPKKFALPYALKMHVRHHTGELPYLCDQCPKAFAVNNHLKKHKLIHTGERPYKCDDCSKTFTQAVHMREHKRTHTGEKPYFCDQCPKSFNESGNLKQHKRTHSTDRPFTCDECQKTFSGPSDLKKHKNSHLKPYMCNYCSKTFSRTAYLKSHILSNHSAEGSAGHKPKPNSHQTNQKIDNLQERFADPSQVKMEILQRYNDPSGQKMESMQRYNDPSMIKMETLHRYNDTNGVRPIVQMTQDNRSVALVQEILFHPKNHQQSAEIKEHENHGERYSERPTSLTLPQEIIPQDMIFPPKKLYS